MTWSYTGDPSSSPKDEYRFHLGDTDESDPILQDEEIEFIIASTTSHNRRLYLLFKAAANRFARDIESKVGPIEEKPLERREYFESQAALYYSRASVTLFNLPNVGPDGKTRPPIFNIGMNDNG